jgi:hypothetical protein
MLLVVFPLAPIPLVSTGCSTILPGQDKVLVNAERTSATAYDVFVAFAEWEQANRDLLWQQSPEIKHLADRLRTNGQTWLKTTRTVTEAYRLNRTEENRAVLQTWLAVLTTAIAEANTYILQNAITETL